jgi:hypothetical protein
MRLGYHQMSVPGEAPMTIAISVAALTLSLATFMTSRWRDRRDLLLRLQDRLVTADQQRGRHIIYRLPDREARVEYLSDEFFLIINAFAALNVLAIYYEQRYVSRKNVLELWASTIDRVLTSGNDFLTTRDASNGSPNWPQLRALGKDARRCVERWARDDAANIAQQSTIQSGPQDRSPGRT